MCVYIYAYINTCPLLVHVSTQQSKRDENLQQLAVLRICRYLRPVRMCVHVCVCMYVCGCNSVTAACSAAYLSVSEVCAYVCACVCVHV